MSKFYKLLKLFFEISKNITKIQIALGRIESKLQKIENSDTISEFQVFSQWGEDGIIEYLVNKIGIENKTFIEFGVENYLESNTRFLLINRNWSGLVIDGSIENINNIKSQDIYWKYNLKVVCEFINKKNINSIFLQNNLQNEIGLLSIDIDGNDYWIWDSIDAINPIIVICEYNSVFGPSEKVSIPYDENFIRNKKHYSNIYYGASISAFNYLAEKKVYSMVAGNLN